MDHVINSIMTYLEIEIGYLIEEWKSKEHKKLSDCPSYGACKAMIDSIHVLEKYLYGKSRTMTVKRWVEFECE